MSKEPLFPHVPKKKEPQFPHMPRNTEPAYKSAYSEVEFDV